MTIPPNQCKCTCHHNNAMRCFDKVGSVDNGIYVNTWGSIQAKKTTGGDKGVPDIILILNGKYRADNKPLCCFVELKKEKGGVVSKEQNGWITELNHAGVHATVAHGYGKAIEWVQSFYQLVPPMDTSFIDSLK